MIETKYLIIIGAVISILILYYFWDEMSNTKKIMMPTYQKTMLLESKFIELEKKTDTFMVNLQNQIQSQNQSGKTNRKKTVDSPALSITYQSDMINKNNNNRSVINLRGVDHVSQSNNNLSVMYADLSETEVNDIRQKMSGVKNPSPKKSPIKSPMKSPMKSDPDMFNFLTPEKNQSQLGLSYQQILDNMSSPDCIQKSTNNLGDNPDIFSSMFDSEVVKCISDSVNNYGDLDQTNMSEISEIPVMSDGVGPNHYALTSEANNDSDLEKKQNKKINKTLSNRKINKKHNLK